MRTGISHSKTLSLMTGFMALLLVVFTAGCDRDHGGALGGGTGNDTVAPLLLFTAPTNSAINVPVNQTIVATFNEPMDPATVSYLVTGPTGTIFGTVAHIGAAYSFEPTSLLTASATYTATITGSDLAGNALIVSPFTVIPNPWHFTTASGPGIGIDLGILAPFGIASYGGITNSGATTINGNAVLDPLATCNAVAVGAGDDFGLCGGAPPTNNPGDTVITQIHPDTTTADAVMAKLLAVWNTISPAGMAGGTVLGCGTIGTGGGAGVGIGCAGNATLPAGVYISATNSTIGVTGELTLDGGGDPNALFVLQAPSALTTAVSSTITLINSARASNVWWFVGSSATLLGNTTFNGNVLASASISMGTGATSCGRLLAGAEGSGAFTFLANTVSVPGHPNAPGGCQ